MDITFDWDGGWGRWRASGRSEIKTQKALSVWELNSNSNTIHIKEMATHPYPIILINLPSQEEFEWATNFVTLNKTFFARPCPLVPRPGFIDSQVVSSYQEIKELWEEIKNEEPEGELILQSYIPGFASSVYLPESGAVMVGSGTDGATDGKETVHVPTVVSKWTQDEGIRKRIKITKSPHLELVYLKEDTLETGLPSVHTLQIRDAEKLPGNCVDFIPEEVKVERLIHKPVEKKNMYGDLLIWEKKILKLKDKKGVVANMYGSSIGSHYALHCISVGIPVVVTKKVKVGDVLTPTNTQTIKFSREDMFHGTAAAEELIMAMGNVYPKNSEKSRLILAPVVTTVLGIIHNYPRLQTLKEHSFLLGFAAKSGQLLAQMCGMGELRHWDNYYRKSSTEDFTTTDRSELRRSLLKCGFHELGGHRNRTSVWWEFLGLPEEDRNKALEIALDIFSETWDEHGYGGPRWGEVVKAGNKIEEILKSNNPTQRKVIGALNNLVHAAHNGGIFLNKFISTQIINWGDKSPATIVAYFPFLITTILGMSNWTPVNDKNLPALEKGLDKYFTIKDKYLHFNGIPKGDK